VSESSKTLWEKATAFAANAVEFANVVTSGEADEAIIAARLESCRSCPKLDRAEDGKEYCGACGCGRWPLARLDRKLAWKALTCPLARPGFANAGGEPEKLTPCGQCNKPRAALLPLKVGDRVVISSRLPSDDPDTRPWRVERIAKTHEKDEAESVYDLKRRRRLGWEWLRKLGRPERATVSRSALDKTR